MGRDHSGDDYTVELPEFEEPVFPRESAKGEESAEEEAYYKSTGAAGGIEVEESEAEVPDHGSKWGACGEEERYAGVELECAALGWGVDVG